MLKTRLSRPRLRRASLATRLLALATIRTGRPGAACFVACCWEESAFGEHWPYGGIWVVAYTQATQLFGIIPIVGGFIASIYALVLHIIGLREAHEITTGRAALAVFIPVIAALIFVVILFAIFFSLFLGSLHSMKPPARVF